MPIRAWQTVLGGGTAAAVLVALIGTTAQEVVLLASCIVCFASVVLGVRIHRPIERGPWLGVASAVALLVIAAVTRAVYPESALGPFLLADILSTLAYCAFIVAGRALGRLRAHHEDPTNLIDSLIFTIAVGVVLIAGFAVPFWTHHATTPSAATVGGAFVFLDLLVFFVAARLAIGPGARTPSYYLLAITAACILLSDVAISAALANMAFVGDAVLPRLLPSVGFFAGGAAALHPTMLEVTKPVQVEVARMTRSRLLFMVVAVLAPPVLLVAFAHRDGFPYLEVFGPVCVLVTVAVMARFAGIAHARERLAIFDRILARASTSLVTATTRDEMHAAALTAAAELVGSSTEGLGVAVATRTGTEWSLASGWSPFANVPSRSIDEERLEAAFAEDAHMSVRTSRPAVGRRSGQEACHELAAPLVSRNQLRGALIVTTVQPIPSVVADALSTLATAVSLALETAGLVEDLHRRRSDKRFRALVENSGDLVIVIDDDDALTFLSPPAERLLAGRHGDVRALLATVHVEDRSAVVSLLASTRRRAQHKQALECRTLDAEGATRWFELTARDLRGDAEIGGIVLNAHDITDRKAGEEALRHGVLHDHLTAIPNRLLFADRVDQALAARTGTTFGPVVLFIGLDDFKTINDGLGLLAGDEVLKVLAFRLQSFLREGDTAARYGGDQFLVLLRDITTMDNAVDIAHRLLEVIAQPIDFEKRDLALTASIGLAIAGPSSDADTLLRNADMAMYHAKSSGKARVQSFDDSMHVNAMDRLDLKHDLSSALARNEFVLYYQPLISLDDARLTGFEALLRWRHPTRGFVGPFDFIPLAEETGLIVPIGAWVLEESCRQMAEWNELYGTSDLKISVNMSPRQLLDENVLSVITGALQASGLPASQLTIELTESAGVEDARSEDRVREIRALGIGLAADDFGSGFANYAALQKLPFTVVKIDRSLIINLPDPTGFAEAQVKSIVDMAHAAGLTVVVEGIEDERQRQALAALGCDRAQGYLFDRPLPPLDATARVRTHVTEVKRRHASLRRADGTANRPRRGQEASAGTADSPPAKTTPAR